MSFEEIQYNKLPQTKDDLNMKCVVLGDAGVGKNVCHRTTFYQHVS